MAIDPKTGIEEVKPVINTEAMKQYNPNYNPNVGSGVSGIMGTPENPAIQANIIPLQANIGGKIPETQSNVPPQPVKTTTAQIVPHEPVSQPTQVEKTTTTTPQGETVVKKETPQAITPDYNTGKGREQDILNNLNEGKKNDSNIQRALQTGDYNTYKQAYGYDTADQTKKQMLDAFFQANQPKNSDAFLQILSTGQKLQNAQYRGSPEAADAQHRYDVLSPYIGAGATSLYDAMVSGKLLPGSDAYKDLLKVSGGIETPAMTEAKIKFERKQQVDKVNNNLANISGNKAETQTGLQKISDNLVQTKGMDYAMEFQKDVVNNPAITEKVTELNSVTEQIKNLEYTKSKSLKEIMKRYPGISYGSAILQANSENEGINDELNQLYNKQGSLKANVDYATNLAEKMFGYKIAKNQEQVKAEQDIASEQRQFARQKELAQYQQDLQLEGNQAEFDQKIKQQAQLANDPYTAISTVMDEYKKLGIPFTQSIQTKVADAQKFIAGGGTIAGYVDKMIGDIQAKPEYKAIQEKKDQEKLISVGKDSYIYDPATGTFKSPSESLGGTGTFTGMDTDLRNSEYVKKYPNEASFKNNNPAGITWNANFDNGTGIAKALQEAGITYSKGTARPKSEGGNYVSFDNIGDGMKARQVVFATTYGNKDLSQALQSWKEGSNRNAGTKQYADSIMKEAGISTAQSITYNNLSQEQKDALTLSQIKRESGGLYKVLTQKPQEGGKSFAPSKIDSFNSLTATDKKKMMNDPEYTGFLDQKNAVMTDENASIYDVMKFSQGGKDMGEERLKSLGKFSQGLSQIADLSKAINTETTGPIIGTLRSYNPYDANAQALVAQINSIVPNIARGVYGEVGVLTDADIQNYAKTLPNIKSTADTNKLVLAMTLSTMLNGFKGQIQIDGSAGRDVSGFNGTVKQYETRINNLLKEIGGVGSTTGTTTSGTPTYQQFY